MPQSFYNKKQRSMINAKSITLAIIVLLLFLAHFTTPSERKMRRSLESSVMSYIKDQNVNKTADIHDVNNMFYAYNSVDVFRHYFYTTVHIHNRYQTQDKIVSIGILGIAIPLVDWDDYVVTNGPVKRHLYHGGKKDAVNTKIIGDNDYDTGELPEDQ